MTTPTACEATEEQRARAYDIASCRLDLDERLSGPMFDAAVKVIAQALAQESARLAGYIREAKHLISVRMEGFPCADGDDCENLKTLQAIAAALEGKES